MKPQTLEQKTDAARLRLSEVLDAIDSRRHVLELPTAPSARGAKRVLKRVALPLGAALGGAGALVATLFLDPRARTARVLHSAGVSLLAYGLVETVKKLGAA